METKSSEVNLPSGLPQFLTVAEVAALLRKKERAIYNMVHQRRIPFRKAGKTLLFDANEIEEWTKASAEKAGSSTNYRHRKQK
ncbi:MAG: hypothetical protein AUG51_19410 [Acidobacteria bacterium 13_1_20CM_3_53_8]|nr:MAG: hypothetical protein AUG51_19410 [Acidobacteria bacterium 13_1_20CM_3_53_8]